MLSYPTQSLHFLSKISTHNGKDNGESVRQTSVPLKLIIVGGGLGGLATSIALARRGHTYSDRS